MPLRKLPHQRPSSSSAALKHTYNHAHLFNLCIASHELIQIIQQLLRRNVSSFFNFYLTAAEKAAAEVEGCLEVLEPISSHSSSHPSIHIQNPDEGREWESAEEVEEEEQEVKIPMQSLKRIELGDRLEVKTMTMEVALCTKVKQLLGDLVNQVKALRKMNIMELKRKLKLLDDAARKRRPVVEVESEYLGGVDGEWGSVWVRGGVVDEEEGDGLQGGWGGWHEEVGRKRGRREREALGDEERSKKRKVRG